MEREGSKENGKEEGVKGRRRKRGWRGTEKEKWEKTWKQGDKKGKERE